MKKHIAFMISCIMVAVCFSIPVSAAVSPTPVTTVDAPLRTYDSKVEVRGQAIQYQAYKTDQMVVQQGVQNNGTTINFLYSEYDLWDTTIHCSYTLTNTSADVVTFDSGALYSNLYVMMSDVNAAQNSATSYQGYYIDNVTNGAVLVSTNSGVNVFRMDSIRSGNQIVILPYQSVSFSYDFHAIWYGVDDGTTSNPNTGVDIQNYTNTVSYSSGGVSSMTFDTFISYQESYEAYFAYHVDQIWTTLQGLYTQGTIDQQKYNQMIDLLDNIPVYHDFLSSFVPSNSWHFNKDLAIDKTLYYQEVNLTSSGFRIVSTDYDIYNVPDGTNTGNRDLLGAIDVYVNLQYYAKTDADVVVNPVGGRIFYEIAFNTGDWKVNGTSWEMIYSDGIIPIQCNPYQESVSSTGAGAFLLYQEPETINNTGRGRYAVRDPKSILLKYTYYFVISDVSLDDLTAVTISSDGTSLTTGDTNCRAVDTTTHTFIWYLTHWWEEQHQDVNQDISNESGSVSDTQDQIHAQEQQWYSDNEAAIEATGLSNFEFTSDEQSGMRQLRLQFSQVWDALGDWTLVYIFVLSLSLATFILRHRPTTKAQQRMADSAKYRQDVRNRWAVQDARSSNNSNGFSAEIWRRAGYR